MPVREVGDGLSSESIEVYQNHAYVTTPEVTVGDLASMPFLEVDWSSTTWQASDGSALVDGDPIIGAKLVETGVDFDGTLVDVVASVVAYGDVDGWNDYLQTGPNPLADDRPGLYAEGGNNSDPTNNAVAARLNNRATARTFTDFAGDEFGMVIRVEVFLTGTSTPHPVNCYMVAEDLQDTGSVDEYVAFDAKRSGIGRSAATTVDEQAASAFITGTLFPAGDGNAYKGTADSGVNGDPNQMVVGVFLNESSWELCAFMTNANANNALKRNIWFGTLLDPGLVITLDNVDPATTEVFSRAVSSAGSVVWRDVDGNVVAPPSGAVNGIPSTGGSPGVGSSGPRIERLAWQGGLYTDDPTHEAGAERVFEASTLTDLSLSRPVSKGAGTPVGSITGFDDVTIELCVKPPGGSWTVVTSITGGADDALVTGLSIAIAAGSLVAPRMDSATPASPPRNLRLEARLEVA